MAVERTGEAVGFSFSAGLLQGVNKEGFGKMRLKNEVINRIYKAFADAGLLYSFNEIGIDNISSSSNCGHQPVKIVFTAFLKNEDDLELYSEKKDLTLKCAFEKCNITKSFNDSEKPPYLWVCYSCFDKMKLFEQHLTELKKNG